MSRRSVAMPGPGIVICRAELADAEGVLESVCELSESSSTAARWSRAAFYPYVASDADSGVLQAKAMFLAYGSSAAGATESGGEDKPIVAKSGIVGFAAFSSILTIGAGESTLENMAVSVPWQSQGIGRRLLAAGLLWCRAQASGTVFLEVRKSNRAAIALYERAGFTAVGDRTGYYREPAEDGLQMQKAWLRSPRRVENSSC